MSAPKRVRVPLARLSDPSVPEGVRRQLTPPDPQRQVWRLDDDGDGLDPLSAEAHDGSAGFHVFREDGRFGSYPSHDDYSDESTAD